MAKILVINAGSSSLKYQLIEAEKEECLAKGLVERIGLKGGLHHYTRTGEDKLTIKKDVGDHTQAIELALEMLLDPEKGVIKSKEDIVAIGHRVVHGGERFAESVLIDNEVMEAIRENCRLAPLHNPHNLKGIEACVKIFGKTPNVAVFDTAFHQKMPPHAYLYALPISMYKEHSIRRYGFHGTSHFFVAHQAAKALGKPIDELKIITLHLGNGASMSAVKGGYSIDTSMGFTPLEGLVMGTRCGDIDPAIPIFMMERLGMEHTEINTILNKKSGLLGLSGISNDMREVEEAAEKGDENAKMALKIYAYRIKKYIGEYTAVMGGVDALVFTAGIGENSALIRKMSLEGLEFLGIKIDEKKNVEENGKFARVEKKGSKVAIFIIPTNEELVIARDTYNICKVI
ncbi:MAG: acetate kinase [Candidatus Coatesbacteria bacterium]|nr:MAG: acetate kinase [Candidatus Coatesbacteria bacterium]RLC43573.1 MAG: acetate kinase [Candidatus Coatesbacteria bacterium]